MAARAHGYSRIIAWLKILLPLAALALLSTLFLVSKPADPGDGILFADPGIADRAARQQLTAPRFSGTTSDGDIITLRASTAQPDPESDDIVFAKDLSARIDLTEGSSVTLQAGRAMVSEADDTLVFGGSVALESSTGYQITSGGMRASLAGTRVESLGQVSGTGPAGRFTAGRMVLSRPDADGSAQLLFTDGIKLVYDPRDRKVD